MIDNSPIDHHIQKHILKTLQYQKVARFRDLRPSRTDSNLFSYHLKLLQKTGYVEKGEGGYTLGTAGLSYVDRVSQEKFHVRKQPKIVTMIVLENGMGQLLLQKRRKQPYIDTWTFPYGKLHIDDASLTAAAQREAEEKLGLQGLALRRAGDCYIRVAKGEEVISSTLVHVFKGFTDTVAESGDVLWLARADFDQLTLAPAVSHIADKVQEGTQFFEEFDIQL